jgi:large subunit ribosomal protein L22
MANATAKTKYVRISPRKARLAAGLIRGLPVAQASVQLEFSQLKAGRLLKKTLDSAVANAETQLELRRDNLKVVEVRVDEGPRMKRSKPKNKGGSHAIIKRTSHFTVVVGQGE